MTLTKKKYLIVKGCAGLGNRLITLTSAISLAKKTNRSLIIDWNDGLYFREGYNFFDDYFNLIGVDYYAPHAKELNNVIENLNTLTVYPPLFKNKIEDNLYDHYVQAFNPLFTKLYHKFPKLFSPKFGGIWVEKKHYKKTANFGFFKYLSCVMSKNSMPLGGHISHDYKEDVVLFADYRPTFNTDLFANTFRLNESTIESINSKIRGHKIQDCIGVHVRATDMQPTNEISIIIDKLKKEFKGKKVFLATDNSTVEKLFLDAGLDMVSIDKEFVTSNEVGIHQVYSKSKDFQGAKDSFEESIADMVLLSQTAFLFYQGNSSFSILSCAMRQSTNTNQDWLKL
ncbi:hypothetical protein K6119_17740 [Paracrocinitomix mangrovi]|uniref:hypothetical protein n=1 Tax=Paracrocinitomix mangrovi TaxID=2862509 RepID=UPI001C8D1C3E|nr:hypothetical protein [Paracrocinitomix mangrovi]UKN01569.1 hypothetical protein K6119_17740 [Paracrocinitomix mangrovi]